MLVDNFFEAEWKDFWGFEDLALVFMRVDSIQV